ncbi:RNA polymerase sigma factor [uncultured Litoreibacter sp.]|uniref:RNA polymerase sigma factor n=1 Tax=uncultured Litoreibacter sp. TaxID=1392394 RepID=UPI002623D695|nr:RNA polymerase sigma factor [uncultured Litoreibacter sp.]
MTRKSRSLEHYLVAAAQLGERPAMEQLVALRGPRLQVHATRLLGDPEEARDAVQDAWVAIFKGLSGLQDTQAFPAWATRIVTRRCAAVIKRKQGDRALSAALLAEREDAAPETGPDAVRAAHVRRAIASLPPDQAATVALFYLDDMGVAEVSVAMDVPVGTVKRRLMLARDKLRTTLKGEENDQ